MKKSTRQKLIERVAEMDHDRWVKWSIELSRTEPGISEQRRRRWHTFWIPYKDIPEDMKRINREWATGMVNIIEKYISTMQEKK